MAAYLPFINAIFAMLRKFLDAFGDKIFEEML